MVIAHSDSADALYLTPELDIDMSKMLIATETESIDSDFDDPVKERVGIPERRADLLTLGLRAPRIACRISIRSTHFLLYEYAPDFGGWASLYLLTLFNILFLSSRRCGVLTRPYAATAPPLGQAELYSFCAIWKPIWAYSLMRTTGCKSAVYSKHGNPFKHGHGAIAR